MVKFENMNEHVNLYVHYFNKEITISFRNNSEAITKFGPALSGTLKARIWGEYPNELRKRPMVIAIVIKVKESERFILMKDIETIEPVI